MAEQEHHEAVYAHAQPSGGRHPLLQGLDEIEVHHVRLVVAARARVHLLQEPAVLIVRVVKLAEGIGQFEAGSERLEPLHCIGAARLELGEGR